MAASRPRQQPNRLSGGPELGDRLRQGLPDPDFGGRRDLDHRLLHHHRPRPHPPPPPPGPLVGQDPSPGPAGTAPSSANWIEDTGHNSPGGPANWGTGEGGAASTSTATASLCGGRHPNRPTPP